MEYYTDQMKDVRTYN